MGKLLALRRIIFGNDDCRCATNALGKGMLTWGSDIFNHLQAFARDAADELTACFEGLRDINPNQLMHHIVFKAPDPDNQLTDKELQEQRDFLSHAMEARDPDTGDSVLDLHSVLQNMTGTKYLNADGS